MAEAEVTLRLVDDADLDALFAQMRDPESVRLAAFTAITGTETSFANGRNAEVEETILRLDDPAVRSGDLRLELE